ncbi:thiamine biosynthesis lipoprotein [Prevotella communis]|jgi:thiamine biosynthesis lipoprotein|uniref:FAD:protein FMN transferase n=1 Tax=Prevotella communis TaxID=2913614 RepID=A0A1G7SFK1_9BACT|nr:FAD:protein FMN transferase [Prevotella communis]UKK59078.1 FAD:protein FMN transferase [Prevotella communis]UKK61848.1 FAD:protein FMN transferase [Prevotella communis]UKK64675.1 FAD:protein FMN transferase [Prevotella communis]SDG21836.1 thiamine biosynthesis lipoprotein [Prevotella communis]
MRRLLFIACSLLLLVSCAQKEYRQNTNFVFGTIYNITYQSDRDLQQEIEAELMKVDGEFSMFNPQSTVARINSGDSTVERSEMFNEIYQLAQTVSKETDGAFDITVAPLVNAWGFGFKHEQLPTPEQVDSLLQLRNQMDFSAIAKGYGCDVVARLLESHGIHNYMVEIGGEVVVSGKNAKGDDWHIGITKPTEDSLNVEGEMQTVLSITDHAMATSGNYRNFYYQGGRKYAHTIDPRTGYPVQHSLLSATVLAENCATADAYATSFMVLGVEGAKAVLARHPELMAYLIYTDEKGQLTTWASPALSDFQ